MSASCLKGSRAAFAARFGVWLGSGADRTPCGCGACGVEAIWWAMKIAPAIQPATTTRAAAQVAGLMLKLMAPATRCIRDVPRTLFSAAKD